MTSRAELEELGLVKQWSRSDTWLLSITITIISILALILMVALWQWLNLVGVVILVGGVVYGVVHLRMKWRMHQVEHRRIHLETVRAHETHKLSMETKRARHMDMSSLKPDPVDTGIAQEIDAFYRAHERRGEVKTEDMSGGDDTSEILELYHSGLSVASIADRMTGKRGGELYRKAKERINSIVDRVVVE